MFTYALMETASPAGITSPADHHHAANTNRQSEVPSAHVRDGTTPRKRSGESGVVPSVEPQSGLVILFLCAILCGTESSGDKHNPTSKGKGKLQQLSASVFFFHSVQLRLNSLFNQALKQSNMPPLESRIHEPLLLHIIHLGLGAIKEEKN